MQYTPLHLDWKESPVVTLAVVRDAFQAELLPALEQATVTHWKEQTLTSPQEIVTRQLRATLRIALRQGLMELTLRAPEPDDACWHLLSSLPPDWEPPEAEGPVDLPAHQSRAYRWTAVLLALRVRNALEDLHAGLTANASMSDLNRSIRNTLYNCLLRNPLVGWRLSEVPRTLVSLIAAGLDLPVPASVG